MDLLLGVFSAFGLSASAGLNAYIPLLAVAIISKFTNILNLNEPWDTLSNWWIIGILVVLSLVEFFADKIPAINHVNDAIQTIIRPVAGAIAFAASANVITEISPVFSLAMGLLVAGGVHAAKAVAVRPAVTATTGGVGNVFVSVAEDVVATVLSILAILIPIVAGILLSMFAAWVIWFFWRRANKRNAQSMAE
ncbi:MAG: DUF4126 domain-containing protein [Chloroflexi bacterium]|jgi:hypothetical protein|nr:DUF4126 domain-containing protein [Chloroflexota bacterium]MBT3670146.1 DUF4126 domain-containing protein [Chloroflexota bacterium]MBT4004015.1 DUF4126 domain-containing protein [Chloroflexota bacterium]MBT4306180.1 DUF4126 domain-containing protein [Chloroflexota bacterium]MBT4534560.1 DUF4126 domain-containing protein [Chloroflexota bacterium]